MTTNYNNYGTGSTASNQANSNAWNTNTWGGTGTTGTGTGNSNWGLGSWTGGWQGTTGLTNQGTQAQNNQNTLTGVSTNANDWNTQAIRDRYSQYMSAMLAWNQANQNNSQYAQDFNEAQRRWNAQFGWTQQGDAFNMSLATRQQQTAEEQARIAAQQWAQQFGWQQQNDQFSQDLANRQLAQQGDLQRQQMAIDDAYNQGRLSNDQRQIALQELAQRADDAWRRDQLAQQLGFSRDQLASQDALARWQTAQQIDAARQNAILQATGRNQAQNAKWMRRA